MISFLSGAALLAGSLGMFRRLRPNNGVPHPLAVTPILQVVIPVAIVGSLVIGIGLVITGLARLVSA